MAIASVKGKLPALARLVRQSGDQIDIDVFNSGGAQARNIVEHGGALMQTSDRRGFADPRMTALPGSRDSPRSAARPRSSPGTACRGAFDRDLSVALRSRNFCEIVTNNRSSWVISSIVGVPPPRKMESTERSNTPPICSAVTAALCDVRRRVPRSARKRRGKRRPRRSCSSCTWCGRTAPRYKGPGTS